MHRKKQKQLKRQVDKSKTFDEAVLSYQPIFEGIRCLNPPNGIDGYGFPAYRILDLEP